MSGHLSRDARLAALDDAADANDRAHLAACGRCRAEVESLAGVLEVVQRVGVPEPSPLFWEHLSSRVREAVAAESQPALRDRFHALPTSLQRPPWRTVLWPAGMGVVIAALLGVLVVRPQTQSGPMPEPTVQIASSNLAADAAEGDAWEFLVALADDTDWTEESLDAIAPGEADRAIDDLSGDERNALAALIEQELRASGDS